LEIGDWGLDVFLRLVRKVEEAHVLMTLTGFLNMGVVLMPAGHLMASGGPIEYVGYVLFVGGTALFLSAGFTLWRGLRDCPPNRLRLITTGVYRWLRHPMYVGFIVAMLGADLVTGSLPGLFVTLVLFLPATQRRARHEELALARELGGEWEAYASRTPSLLLLDWPRR